MYIVESEIQDEKGNIVSYKIKDFDKTFHVKLEYLSGFVKSKGEPSNAVYTGSVFVGTDCKIPVEKPDTIVFLKLDDDLWPDVSNAPLSQKEYGGASDGKYSITYNNKQWMVKFPKYAKDGSLSEFSHLSEHYGCKIISQCGIKAQETMLAQYEGKQCVLCQDFVSIGETLVEFDATGQGSTYEGEIPVPYSYDQILHLLYVNKRLVNTNEALEFFWNLFIMDAFLGNFDRHGNNWGLIKSADGEKYRIAPVYDCGSTLYPRINEEDCEKVLSDKSELYVRVFEYPYPPMMEGSRKLYYHEVIKSGKYDGCASALIRMLEKINLKSVIATISNSPYYSELRKHALSVLLIIRYLCLLEEGDFDEAVAYCRKCGWLH